MYYEINVSKNGMHFFATHKRSITTETQLINALKVFKEKFLESEGYYLSASLRVEEGKGINIEELLTE